MSTAPTPIPDFTGDLPNPADPVTFTERGLAWWNHERYVAFPGMNDLAENAYDNALAAEMSADTAAALAGATMWVAATNYATGTAAISPINGQTYRRKSPGGVDATDPSASADWWLLGGTAIQKAGDTGIGPLSFDFAATIGKDSFMDGTPSHDGSITSWSPTFSNPLTNTSAHVGAVPNGSGSGSGYYAKAGAGSALWGGLLVNPSGIDIHSSRSSASGDEGPINFKFRNVTKISFAKGGVISAYGLRGRQGTSGATLSNAINLFWTGSTLELWVDTTKIGTVNFTP